MELAFIEQYNKCNVEYPEEENFKSKRKEAEEEKKKLIKKARETKSKKNF